MKTKRLFFFSFAAIALIAMADIPPEHQLIVRTNGTGLLSGRNVNMVGGSDPVTEEPYDIGLQRQNEPSIAVSTRNPMHLIAAANDWRPVAMDVVGEELPGVHQGLPATDAWMGIYKSINEGDSFYCGFLPGSPVEENEYNSPIYGYNAVADPVLASGGGGLVIGGAITFNRGQRGEGALFAFRYLDRNNQEAGDPWVYVDTQILDLGGPGHFIDKEWVIVDRPRTTQLVQLPTGDFVPKFNVFIVYTSFMGETEEDAHGKLMLAMSHDSGNTWTKPTQITDAGMPYQAACMTIDQRNGRLHISYRRFARDEQTDAIMLLSQKPPNKYDEEIGYTHEKIKFGKPVVVAEIDPFDQATTPTTFRTNTYPSITSDHKGLLYIVDAERNEQNYSEILLRIHNPDTGEWGGPFILGGEDDYPYAGDPGHKFQPMICYNQGYLTAVWLDSRFDATMYPDILNPSGYGYYVEKDPLLMPLRRTIDVRAMQFEPFQIGDNPVFPQSIQVSKYPWFLPFEPDGSPGYAYQLLHFKPTLELFAESSRAFIGDYIGLAGSPPFVPDGNGGWKYNTEKVENPVFHVAWADNRDVMHLDYLSHFSIPGSECLNPDWTGTRNQNVYTSRLTRGIIAGSPGNTKPLNTKRAFVILIKNTTEFTRSLHLTIEAPMDVNAKFRETGLEETPTADITVLPYSSYAATVVVYPNDDKYASVTVKVWEGGVLLSEVVLNPDRYTPWIEEPDVDYTTPHVAADNEIHTPHVAAYQIVYWSTEEANPHVAAPHVAAPHVAALSFNDDVVTPHVAAPHVAAPHVAAPHVAAYSLDIVNPHVAATPVEDIYADTDITDVYVGVENRGNTTSAYAVSSLPANLPDGVLAQLLVYRVHTTTSARGCELVQEEHHELLVNSLNPHVAAPHVAAVTPELSFRTGTAEPSDFVDAKFGLKPQERAIVLYRFIDEHTDDGEVFYPEVMELEISPDTPDVIDNVEQDLVTLPLIIETPARLPNGIVEVAYPNVQLVASGGTLPYEWSMVAADSENPVPNWLQLDPDGFLHATPGYTPQVAQEYKIKILVTDTATLSYPAETAEKEFKITVLPDNSIEISGWARGVGGTGLEGVAIEFSGQAGVTLTDGNGYYSHRVPYNWTGTSKAYLRGYYAEPAERTYTNLTLDAANQDFTLYLLNQHVMISGVVTEDIGGTPTPVEGVVIDFSDEQYETTDANGYYSHFVTAGWGGTATPSLDGYFFIPSSETYNNIVTNQVTDYTAIPIEGEIAYIYSTDITTANSYNNFLESIGYTVDLIQMDSIIAGIFDDYDLILVGSDTGNGGIWGDSAKVDAINNSGKPLLGLGEGGYSFFGKLSLAIGYGNGWHGSDTDMIVVDSSHAVFNTPNNLGVTTGQTISIYSATNHVGIYLPAPPENVVLLGREVVDPDHYPLVQEQSRYLLWGWTGSPDSMTQTGKDLFENVVNLMAGILFYEDNWDVPGDFAGWQQNTIYTILNVVDTGGNPGGYLSTQNSEGYPQAGACTEKTELTDNYSSASIVKISFDLNVFNGLTGDFWIRLRIRYKEPGYNGWTYLFSSNPPMMNEWNTYSVTFDPNWTDSEAIAAGWEQEVLCPSFSATMSDVYYIEVRMAGISGLLAGIDNFTRLDIK